MADLIERLRRGLEGVTPDPWCLAFNGTGKLRIIQRAGSELGDVEISGEFARDEDAEHLANCSAGNIRALRVALAKSEEARETAERERDGAQKMFWAAKDRADATEASCAKSLVEIAAAVFTAEAAESSLSQALARIEELEKALATAGEAISEYIRYLDGGEMRGSYDGKPERDALRKAGYVVRSARARPATPIDGGGQ